MKRDLVRTNAFVRAARGHVKRNPRLRSGIESTLRLLSEDAFDARLKTHKLKGDMEGAWACSAGYDLRILFEFVSRKGVEEIVLLTLGTHDEVY